MLAHGQRYNRPVRALGVDFGERRIGLAISDPDGRFALPLTTFERRDDRRAARRIAAIVRDLGISRLIVGEPRTLAGARGEAAERVRRFGARLAAATGLAVEWIDEALTSRAAEARLREAGIDPRREPGRVDAVAAQILLQEALDQGAARP